MITTPSKLPLIAQHILSGIEKRVQDTNNKEITDEELLNLHSIFGPVLERALDILEKQPTLIAYHTTNRLRYLIEINGENDRCYRVFPNINFCPCRAFKHQVLERKVQIFCKHVLAAKIAQIVGKIENHEVTQDQ